MYPVEFDVPHNGLEWLEWYNGHKVFHPGWDLNAGYGNQDKGNPVVCPVDGVVDYVSPQPTYLNGQNGGFGWFVILYHAARGRWSRYAHLDSVTAVKGQKMKMGHNIGKVGNTGTVSAHLHFEVFGEEMFLIQSSYWRKFGYYPTKKTKSWVMAHYQDGLAWIDAINDEEDPWYREAQALVIKDGVSKGENPGANPTNAEMWQFYANIKEKFNKKK